MIEALNDFRKAGEWARKQTEAAFIGQRATDKHVNDALEIIDACEDSISGIRQMLMNGVQPPSPVMSDTATAMNNLRAAMINMTMAAERLDVELLEATEALKTIEEKLG